MATRGKPKKLDGEALWEYALRVLGRRAHSAGELKQKLAQRADSAATAASVMTKLREYGFTDDRKYAETFAAARLEDQGYGRLRVLRDLQAKRVPAGVAQNAVEKTFAETDEAELIRRFLDRKYRGKNLSEFLKGEKNVASAYRRLRTAGFSTAGSLRALRAYSKNSENWDEMEEEEEQSG